MRRIAAAGGRGYRGCFAQRADPALAGRKRKGAGAALMWGTIRFMRERWEFDGAAGVRAGLDGRRRRDAAIST